MLHRNGSILMVIPWQMRRSHSLRGMWCVVGCDPVFCQWLIGPDICHKSRWSREFWEWPILLKYISQQYKVLQWHLHIKHLLCITVCCQLIDIWIILIWISWCTSILLFQKGLKQPLKHGISLLWFLYVCTHFPSTARCLCRTPSSVHFWLFFPEFTSIIFVLLYSDLPPYYWFSLYAFNHFT